MEAINIDISAAAPLGKPCRSKNLHGVMRSKAIKQAKASGFKICCPRYNKAKTIIKHKRGLTSFAKTIDVEEDLHIAIH